MGDAIADVCRANFTAQSAGCDAKDQSQKWTRRCMWHVACGWLAGRQAACVLHVHHVMWRWCLTEGDSFLCHSVAALLLVFAAVDVAAALKALQWREIICKILVHMYG